MWVWDLSSVTEIGKRAKHNWNRRTESQFPLIGIGASSRPSLFSLLSWVPLRKISQQGNWSSRVWSVRSRWLFFPIIRLLFPNLSEQYDTLSDILSDKAIPIGSGVLLFRHCDKCSSQISWYIVIWVLRTHQKRIWSFRPPDWRLSLTSDYRTDLWNIALLWKV